MWACNQVKSPGKVFSSLSSFSILAQAIMLLPIALAAGAGELIGFNRLREFLGADEYNSNLDHVLNNLNDQPSNNSNGSINSGDSIESPIKHFSPYALTVTNGNFTLLKSPISSNETLHYLQLLIHE